MKRHFLLAAIILWTVGVALLLLVGCASGHVPPGRYHIPAHDLIIESRQAVDAEYAKRQWQMCGEATTGPCVRQPVNGFHNDLEIWCAVGREEMCYWHEIKHLLRWWDWRH